MTKKKRRVFELDRTELEGFAEWVNIARYEMERIAIRYELSNQVFADILANSFRLAKSILPKLYMKLVHNNTYQQHQSRVVITLTEAEIYALRIIVGILNIESPNLNNTNEVRQLMMFIQF